MGCSLEECQKFDGRKRLSTYNSTYPCSRSWVILLASDKSAHRRALIVVSDMIAAKDANLR